MRPEDGPRRALTWNAGPLGSGSRPVITDRLILCQASDSQSRVPGPAVSTSPGNWVETHILGLHPQLC